MIDTFADPWLGRALRLVTRLPRSLSPEHQVRLLVSKLFAEDLSPLGMLDVGIWGEPLRTAAAERAIRLQAVALAGDETPGGRSTTRSDHYREEMA